VRCSVVLPPSVPKADYRLRIFTPRGETPFAGHPTIGSAHAVIEHGLVSNSADSLVQECGVGLLRLTVERRGTEQMIFVDAPVAQFSDVDAVHLDTISLAVDANPRKDTPPQIVDVGPRWLIMDLGLGDVANGGEGQSIYGEAGAAGRLGKLSRKTLRNAGEMTSHQGFPRKASSSPCFWRESPGAQNGPLVSHLTPHVRGAWRPPAGG
jgi:hypothetical protein